MKRYTWPRKLSNGMHYVCDLKTGAEYAYDWNRMRVIGRLESAESRHRQPIAQKQNLTSTPPDTLTALLRCYDTPLKVGRCDGDNNIGWQEENTAINSGASSPQGDRSRQPARNRYLYLLESCRTGEAGIRRELKRCLDQLFRGRCGSRQNPRGTADLRTGAAGTGVVVGAGD